MELNILHLYPRLMSLYGEWANVAVLRRHLEVLGVTVTVTGVPCGETPDFTGADLIYMGAGTERSQKAALTALAPHGPALREALERGTAALFTGNAMELLGTSVTDAAGKRWECLGLAGFSTEETDRRFQEDVVARPALWEEPAVGFMNKCSVTHGIDTPLFPTLLRGPGNDGTEDGEGYVSGDLLATHLTGPVLAKNPGFTDYLVKRLFAVKGWELPPELPALPYEREAHAVTLAELSSAL